MPTKTIGFVLHLFLTGSNLPVNHAPFWVFPTLSACEADQKSPIWAPDIYGSCQPASKQEFATRYNTLEGSRNP